jgi:hypothetical protein
MHALAACRISVGRSAPPRPSARTGTLLGTADIGQNSLRRVMGAAEGEFASGRDGEGRGLS